MTEIVVREAGIGDAPAIGHVHVRSWQEAYRGQVPDQYLDRLSIRQRVDVWRDMLATGGRDETNWVVMLHGELVGFAGAGPSRDAGTTTADRSSSMRFDTGSSSRSHESRVRSFDATRRRRPRRGADLRGPGFDQGAHAMTGPPPPPPGPANADAARETTTSVIDALEATMGRAASFTEQERNQSVDGEWSTVESLRHLVLVIDVHLSRNVRGEADPFHPIALPPSFMPPKLPGSSIDPEARPTFAEACEVLRGRLSQLRSFVDELSADELGRPIEAHAGTVSGALGVIFKELSAHDGFINRDLSKIEQARV